jgi:hypothetical protein
MRSIGLRSLFWSVMTAVMAILEATRGRLNISDLEQLDPRVTLAAGFCAITLGGIVYRGFRLEEKATTVLVWLPDDQRSEGTLLIRFRGWSLWLERDSSRRAFEFSPAFQRFIVTAFFVLVSAYCFGPRELNTLAHASDTHYLGRPRYCPSPDGKKQVQKNRPECRLIYRAYELGYTKDLGKCGDDTGKKPEMCDLQMSDEPNLHYAYRVFSARESEFSALIARQDKAKLKEDFHSDVQRFRPLLKDYFAQINNEPQAAHILLTNLPNPRGPVEDWIYRTYMGAQCRREYQSLPNQGPKVESPADAGKAFAHSYGQLLFESSYPTTVAHCDEFHIVWNVPEALCADLPKDPDRALAQVGAKQPLERVLAFYDRKHFLRPGLKYRKPSEFMSVNCLTFGDRNQNANALVKFHDQAFSYRWLALQMEMPAPSSIRITKNTAHVLAPSFTYSGFQSKAGFNSNPLLDVKADSMAGEGFGLSRLGLLRDVDVFLGAPWLEQRADLMEIYPYYLHLAHFVESFRNSYRMERGRIQ